MDTKKITAEKFFGIHAPSTILVFKKDCEIQEAIIAADIIARKSLTITKGKLVKAKYNIQTSGNLIARHEETKVIAEKGFIKIGGLIKCGEVKSGKFIKAESIDANKVRPGICYNIITNKIKAQDVGGRVWKKNPL